MQILPLLWTANTPNPREGTPSPGKPVRPPALLAEQGSHLAAVLLLLLQQLGNRGHGDAGLEQGPSGCARKEEAGPPPGRLSGAAAAPPPPASLPDGGWRPLNSATIPAAPGAGQRHATCSPRAASPVPEAVHLGAGQRSNAGPTLAPCHADTSTGGPGRERRVRTLSQRGTPRERARTAAGRIYCSARVQDGDRR